MGHHVMQMPTIFISVGMLINNFMMCHRRTLMNANLPGMDYFERECYKLLLVLWCLLLVNDLFDGFECELKCLSVNMNVLLSLKSDNVCP